MLDIAKRQTHKKIASIYKNWEIEKDFNSIKEASEFFGIERSLISRQCSWHRKTSIKGKYFIYL